MLLARASTSAPWASAAVSYNRTEENSFFGVPLLLACGAVTVLLWRRPLVRALAVLVVVACWLSLGEEVLLNGEPTGIPGLWGFFEQVPVVENVLPTRFALVAVPALGALLALGLEEVRRASSRYAAHAGAGLAVAGVVGGLVLLPVLPTPLVVDARAPMPAFFRDGSWREWVDDGGSVLAEYTAALVTTARYDYGYALIARFAPNPAPGAPASQFYLLDALGSTSALADEGGNLVQVFELEGEWADVRDPEVLAELNEVPQG